MSIRIVSDLHLHSRYSMATSPRLNLEAIATAAQQKGIGLLAAPDFTHPKWREEMQSKLIELQPAAGVYSAHGTRFILIAEVSCVWRQNGKGRRVHLLMSAPNFAAAERLSKSLSVLQNLESDGRPILKLSARDLFHRARDIDQSIQIIPAHVFTPWYGVFGDKSGFNSLEECFSDMAAEIHAVETGLSSDPAMHWALPGSSMRSIVSFSDAHSTRSIGRECTVLQLSEMSYDAMMSALRRRKVVATYEFHPAHGKYYLDGHRKCGIRMTPEESAAHDKLCPACGKPLTIGVLNRSQQLQSIPQRVSMKKSNSVIRDEGGVRAPFRHLIPLRELLSQALGVGINTKRVERAYLVLLDSCGTELDILLKSGHRDIVSACGDDRIADAIIAARNGDVSVDPGYDGVYGSVFINR